MMQSHEHEYRRLESIIDAANERIRELTDAFEDAENRIIELLITKAEAKALREALKNQGEPVAWRYRNANGVYRYRGYVPDFDKTHAILKPIPLYTSAPTIPEGWQLVPIEPTEEMFVAGDQFMECTSSLGEAWEAMLSAAPKYKEEVITK